MNCIKCDSEESSEFYREEFECKCGEINTISYHACLKCGWMWREVNGKLSEGSEVSFDQLNDLMDKMHTGYSDTDAAPYINVDEISEEEFEGIMENMRREIEKVARIDSGQPNSMSDYVHRCLRCNELAHEEKPGIFKCSVCGFEWEVISIA